MKRYLALAPLLLFSSVDAAVPHDVCVNQAVGVPLRSGPPNWWDATTAGGDPALDDPRWNQSTAHSFEFGSATAPLHVRALWTNTGGEALLLSFVLLTAGFAPAPLPRPERRPPAGTGPRPRSWPPASGSPGRSKPRRCWPRTGTCTPTSGA